MENNSFTCIGRGHGAPAVPATGEDWLKMRREKWLKNMCERIAAGDDDLKHRLPVWTPHCAEFNNNHRAIADALKPLNRLMLDFDEKGHTEEICNRLMEKSPLLVLLIEESVRKGTHVLVELPEGMTPEQAQELMKDATGFTPDAAVKDVSRCIYMVSDDHTKYMSEKLFDVSESQLVVSRSEEREVRSENTPSQETEAKQDLRFKGILYSDIIQEYWNRTDGEPQEGERNVKLYQLAVNLRAICDNSRARLMQVMPRYGLSEQELQSIVESACKEPPKGISKLIQKILDELSRSEDTSSAANNGQCSSQRHTLEERMVNGQRDSCPQIPKKLPKLVQLLTSNTPEMYRAAVAHALFPPLATHLCDVRFNYTDNVEHEATLMNCLMAGTGAGKGCIDEPIRHIMADIKRRDEENERREAEWKKDCQKKGANKDKMVRPEGLVIQMIDPDMTKPALVTRMDEAEGHFVYVKLNELDLFEQLKGQTGKQHFQLMCLAFDPGAEYGQTRIGTQSVTARPRCRFNWNACTTILKGRRFFNKVLTDGPISRINFCTIPEMEIGCEQPIYGRYDAAFDEALRPYIDNLVAARGLIDCPQAFKLAKKLQQECAEFARLSQSEVYWNLSHRACVIAWLKACVLYVANGEKWEKSIEEFIRWSLQYDLWCKMQFFGDDIEKANNGDGARIGTRGPRNLLELLPDEFTLEDAKRVRRQQGLSNEGLSAIKMIRTWSRRGYVKQKTENSFQKNKLR